MGGLGSGRQRTRLGLDACRALELGELCDQGRWRSEPGGEVLWRTRRGGETLARLSYAISGQEDAGVASGKKTRPTSRMAAVPSLP